MRVQTARRTAAPRPINAVPTSTIIASSRIAGIPEPARWTATGGAAVTDDSSVAAGEDPEAVVASANPASVSVTSCLRITVGSSPRRSIPFTEVLAIDRRVSVAHRYAHGSIAVPQPLDRAVAMDVLKIGGTQYPSRIRRTLYGAGTGNALPIFGRRVSTAGPVEVRLLNALARA